MKKMHLAVLSLLLLLSFSCKSTNKSIIVVSVFPNHTTYLVESENKNLEEKVTSKDTKKSDSTKKGTKNQSSIYGKYNVKETERGDILVLEKKVNFNFQSFKAKKGSGDAFKYVKDFMTEYPDVKIIVEGHTDKYGKVAYNYTLANKRALEGVRNITALGIKKSRLIAKPIGSKLPEFALSSENRRLEFIVIKDDNDLNQYQSYMKKRKI